jgi:hypothetical protein
MAFRDRIEDLHDKFMERKFFFTLCLLSIWLTIYGWHLRPERVHIHVSGEPEPYNTYPVDLLFLSGKFLASHSTPVFHRFAGNSLKTHSAHKTHIGHENEGFRWQNQSLNSI